MDRLRGSARCYPRRTVRLIEIRLLDGPNVYRLEPVVKVEVGDRPAPDLVRAARSGPYALVRLGATVPASEWPDGVATLADWVAPAPPRATGEGLDGIRRPSLVRSRATGS